MNYGIMNAKTKHNITIRTALWEEKKHDIEKKGGLEYKQLHTLNMLVNARKGVGHFLLIFK